MSSDGDFDDFVDELGGFGKYQKRLLYLLLCKCELRGVRWTGSKSDLRSKLLLTPALLCHNKDANY